MREITAILMTLSFLTACGGGSPERLPPPPAVEMETLINVTSRDMYFDQYGSGYAHICPGAPAGYEPRSFLIVVNGFSPEAVDRQPASGELESLCAGHDTGANYNLIQTRWSAGGDYIQRNAGFIRELLETVSKKYEITSDDRLAIVGLSMGGLVSRYALQSMETDGVLHNIDLFVSVDAPQQGAYVPIGVQHLAHVFRDDGGQPTLDILDTPAARQMLIYHYTQGSNEQTWTDEHQALFVEELGGSLGGFLQAEGLRTVAVSSGRMDGVLEQPTAGSQYLFGELKESRVRDETHELIECPFSDTLTYKLNIDLFIVPQAWSLDTTRARVPIRAGVTTTVKVASSDVETKVNGIDLDNRSALISHFKQSTKDQLPLYCDPFVTDEIVGRVVDKVINQAQDEAAPYVENYKDKVFVVPPSTRVSEGVPGGLSEHIGELRTMLTANGFSLRSLSPEVDNKNTSAFISVPSALMIEGNEVTYDFTDNIFSVLSPFDEIYIESDANLYHLESTTDWFRLEVMALFDAT